MVNYNVIDSALSALADPTRRQIVERLTRGEATLSELAEPHDMSLPAVMKHVRKLSDAGLVTREKTGRVVTCRLNAAPLDETSRWLNEHLEFWNARLDALGEYLEKTREDDT